MKLNKRGEAPTLEELVKFIPEFILFVVLIMVISQFSTSCMPNDKDQITLDFQRITNEVNSLTNGEEILVPINPHYEKSYIIQSYSKDNTQVKCSKKACVCLFKKNDDKYNEIPDKCEKFNNGGVIIDDFCSEGKICFSEEKIEVKNQTTFFLKKQNNIVYFSNNNLNNNINVDDIKKCPGVNVIDIPNDILCETRYSLCKLVPEAIPLLTKANELAKKEGYTLKVTNAYRTYHHQYYFWNLYNQNKTMVADPNNCNAPHRLGKAVDVVLFKGKTQQPYKKLEEIMTKAGWVRYAKEAWHFECCNTARVLRAKAAGVSVIV
jgi:D-alanyl-D-alanine carboxypeptidase-like protein